jgi:DNA-binding XRE family transcriptional regulator
MSNKGKVSRAFGKYVGADDRRLFVVLLIFFVFSLFVASSTFSFIHQINRLKASEDLNNFLSPLGAVVNNLQKERGYSAALIGNKSNAIIAARRITQMNETDRVIEIAKRALPNTKEYKRFQRPLIGEVLGEIAPLRRTLLDDAKTLDEVMGAYNPSVRELIWASAAPINLDPQHASSYNAYLALSFLEEYIGAERALSTAAIASGGLPQSFRLQLARNIERQEAYEESFLFFASPSHIAMYVSLQNSALNQEISSFEGALIIDRNIPQDIKPSVWFDTLTAKIDRLEMIKDTILQDISAQHRAEIRAVLIKLCVSISLTLLSILGMVALFNVMLRKGEGTLPPLSHDVVSDTFCNLAVKNDSEIAIAIGQHIKRLRTQGGMSQEELAKKADLNRSYLSNVESGKKKISVSVLVKLAIALDIPPHRFLLESWAA